jgi:hypothetical protein
MDDSPGASGPARGRTHVAASSVAASWDDASAPCNAPSSRGGEHATSRPTPARPARRWLNIAENELSCLTRQCVAGRRFGDIQTLAAETSAWSRKVNRMQRGVDWQLKIDDARCKLKSVHPKIEL